MCIWTGLNPFTLPRPRYRLGLLTTACILFNINSWKFGWDSVCSIKSHVTDSIKNWLIHMLSFTVEKQKSNAHLFQQQTDKHCWSFHPLSGQAFPQQPSSCKRARWKSCIHSLDGAAPTDCSYMDASNNIWRCHQNIIKVPLQHTSRHY